MAYGYNDMLALLQELQDFAWVGADARPCNQGGSVRRRLKKLLTSYRVVTHTPRALE